MVRYPMLVVEASPDEADVLIGRLSLLGAEGIEERDDTTLAPGGPQGLTLVASFASLETAEEARTELSAHYAARIDFVEGDDWLDGWKQHWRATHLTDRIVVVPSWLEHAAAPGELVLRLDPGRAFGTGQHASTALAARALERRVTARRPDRVLDVGCGSGILAFAALLLGVPQALGSDTDPDAVASARENARSLGLAGRTAFHTGSVEVLPGPAGLVLANIQAGILIDLCAGLAGLVAPGGALVLSGVLAGQREPVVRAYEGQGLRLERCDAEDEWIAPEFGRA